MALPRDTCRRMLPPLFVSLQYGIFLMCVDYAPITTMSTADTIPGFDPYLPRGLISLQLLCHFLSNLRHLDVPKAPARCHDATGSLLPVEGRPALWCVLWHFSSCVVVARVCQSGQKMGRVGPNSHLFGASDSLCDGPIGTVRVHATGQRKEQGSMVLGCCNRHKRDIRRYVKLILRSGISLQDRN